MAPSELFEHPLGKEVIAYQGMQAALESEFFGRWVIIQNSLKKGGDYASYHEAETAARDMGLNVLACFIRQVGVDSAVFLSHGK